MAGGSATITTSGKKTDIHQSSNKVILDWRSFDIGSDEHTQFHQPSKNAIALNRINDTKASKIDGKLTANGKIMLINPNGVVFGSGAQVDVGSLTATTADIDNDDFMAGKMDFKNAGNTAGAIVNNGNITVKDAGLVNFVAPRVENNGVIVAKLGKVQLAAADTFALDMAGDGLLQVAVTEEDSHKIAKNSGTISAEGGYVAVTAAKARGLVDSLVDNTGIIEASSMTTKGGKIILSAHGGTTRNSGTIKANGKTGGGEILIGGDYQGVGDTKNSQNTEIAQSSVIEASATDTGDGGKVIVWADENTIYNGTIKAQGGMSGGNGGFVETSGKKKLHVAEGSSVTASARYDGGEAGVWLLDPSNVTITDGSGDNIPGSGGTVNPPYDSYTIDASSITAALNGGNNVIIATTSGSGEAGDITVVNATIGKTVANNSVGLSLRAARNITIENSSITSSANGIGLTINADRDANSTGAVKISNSNINLNGGSLVIGGGTTVAATPVYASQDGVFDAGVTIDNSTIQTNGAGNITIRGAGENTGNNNYGVLITNNSLLRTNTTGASGTINIYGTGGAGGSNNHGVYITGGSTVRSDRGATITGTGGSNGTIGSLNNVGVYIDGNSNVQSRGTGSVIGNIAITGTGGNGYGGNHGFKIDGDSSYVFVTDGDLLLSGTSGFNAALGASPGTNYGVLMSTDSDITSNSATVGEAGNITINSVGEDTVLGGDTITSVAGNITINANRLDMALDALSSTSGNITIAPYTDSTSIGLGGGTGDLNLTDAELALVSTAGKFIIGKSVTGTGDIDLDSWNWSSKLYGGIEIYGNDIDIGGMTMGAGDFLAHAMDNGGDLGDLNISSGITRSVNGVATLDLRADHNITNSNNSNIIANDANSDGDGNATTSADSLNVILNADRNNNDDGSIAITGSNITTLGGYFVAGGGSGIVGGVNGILGDGDGTGADDDYAYIVGSGDALVLTTTTVTTGGGDAILNGFASGAGTGSGVIIDRSKIISGDGDIIVQGRSTGSVSNPKGLSFTGDFSNRTAGLIATGGDIKIFATTTLAQALYLWEDSEISTVDGNIDIRTYTSGTTVSLGAGGTTPTNHITSTNGNVTLALDDANLSGIYAITAGNTLTIKGYDPSMSIGLGGGTGDLNLNDGELTKLVANRLVFGDALLGTGDIDLDSWDWSSKSFTNVELYGNDIDIGGMTMGAGSFMAHAKDNGVDYGDLNISANITRAVNGDATVDLRADRNITNSNNAGIIASDANSDADGNPATSPDRLNVILNADRNGNQDGAIYLTSTEIKTLGGYFVAGGGTGTIGGVNGILGDGDGTGADDVAAYANSSYANGVFINGNSGARSNITTEGGNIIVNGTAANLSGGNSGLKMAYTTMGSGTGNIKLKGNLTTSGNISRGLYLDNSALNAAGGNISLHGIATTASSAVQDNKGVVLEYTPITSTGTGDIEINGTVNTITGNTHWSNYGINLNLFSDITYDDGDVRLISNLNKSSGKGMDIGGSSIVAASGSDGNILFEATGNSGDIDFSWGSSTIGGANATGDIIFRMNRGNLTFNASTNFYTAGNAILTGYNNNTIYVGSTASDSTVRISDLTMQRLNVGGKVIVGTPSTYLGDIFIDSLDLSGRSYNLDIHGNDITFQDTDATSGVDYALRMGAGNITAHAMDNGVDYGDLDISANITRAVNGDATLDLRADRNITNSNNAGIIASDANSDADGNPATSPDRLNVILNADRNANNDGAITLANAAITTLGGNFIAGGGSGTVGGVNGILGDGDGTGADDIAAWGNSSYINGINFTNTDITAASGTVILNGHGLNNAAAANNFGIGIRGGSEIVTTSGRLYFVGTGGSGTQSNYGLFLDSSSKISSGTGAINITGTGAGTTQWNDGVLLDSTVESTGSATITITGIAGGGTASNDLLLRSGVLIGGANAAGNITFNVDSISLSASSSVLTSGDKIVKPRTASTSIGLGGGAGDLNLIDDELAVFGGAGRLIIGDALLGTGDIDLDSWNWSTKLFGIEIYGNDIDIGGMTMGAGNFLAHAMDNGVDTGDIVISANITRAVNGDATLDLRADRNIENLNGADIIASDANSDADGNPATSPDRLNVILNADRDADHAGSIYLAGASITTLGGNVVMGGGNGAVGGADGILGNGDGTGADDVMAWGNASSSSGIYLGNNSSINAGAGSIYMNGHGRDDAAQTSQFGVNLFSGGNISTTSGRIQINGYGGTSNTISYGVQMHSSTISTATGFVDITAHGGTASSGDSDFVIFNNSAVESTGSGSIRITGTSGAASNFNIGLAGINRIGNANMTGDIEIIGNTIQINDTDNTILSQGNIYIKPLSPSQDIGLGGGSGGLNLTDAELANFNGTGKLIIGDALLGTGDIDLDSWDWSTKLFSVQLYGNDIDIGGMTMGVGNFMAYAKDNGVDYGDLNISANITRSVNGISKLDLRADRNIVNSNGADIIATDANSDGDNNAATDADSLNIILNADRNANQDGAVRLVNAAVNTLGGYFVAGGGSGTVGGTDGILGNGDGTGADDVAAWGNSVYGAGINLGTSSINTAAGAIYMKGQGAAASTETDADLSASGIRLLGSSLTTTGAGSINLHGTGGGAAGSNINVGVFLRSGSTIQSANGAINVYGRGGSVGSNSHGLGFSGSGVNTITTANGHIQVQAQAADTTRPAIYGASVGGGILSTGNGGITLTALNSGITTAAAFTIGGASASGDIILDTDLIDLAAGTNIRTSGDIYVTPRTATTTIGLGGGAGDLNLTDNELGYFNGTGKLIIGNAAAGTGDVDLDSWNWSTKLFGIELYGNDIDIGGMTMGVGNFMAYAKDNGSDYGDLNISADITRGVNGNATLDLRADHNITNSNSASIIASDANSDGDGNPETDADRLHIILNADRNSTNDAGTVNLGNGSILSNGGNILLGGGNGGISAGSGFARAPTAAYFNGVNLSNTIDAQGGDIVINGDANGYFAGVSINSSSRIRTKGTGTINIYGIGGSGNGSTRGVSAMSGSIISNNGGTGAININGRTTSVLGTNNHAVSLAGSISSGGLVSITGVSTYNGHGVNLANTGTIATTGGFGALNVTGTAHGTGYNGINFVTHASNTISTESGDITLTSLAGDIVIDKGIRKTGTGVSTLTIRTPSNIVLNSNADIAATNGSLNVILNADRDANNSGAVSMTGVSVTTNGGNFVAGGGSGAVGGVNGILGDGDGTGADDVAAWGNSDFIEGVKLDTTTVSTGNGSIHLTGHGWNTTTDGNHGVLLTGGNLGTNNGSINVSGTAGVGGSNNRGVYFLSSNVNAAGAGDILIEGRGSASTSVNAGTYNIGFTQEYGTTSAHGGLIDIRGYGGTTNGWFSNYGFEISGASGITNSNAGDIYIFGQSSGTSANNNGIRVWNDNSFISTSGSGDITLEATTASPGTAIDLQSANSVRTTGTGDVVLLTDSLSLGVDGAVNSANDVFLAPRTSGASITLGGTSGSTVNFDDTIFSRILADRLVVGNSAGGNGDLTVDTLDLSSRTYDLEIYGNDVTISGLTMGSGDFMAYAKNESTDDGDLAVSTAITRSAAGTSVLDLRADRRITFSGSANITSTTGQIDVIIDSDYDNVGGGAIAYNAASIDTNGGYLTIAGSATIGTDASWNARGGTVTTIGAITMGVHDLTVIADNATIGNNITGSSGTLTLKPYDNARSIGIGGGAGDFNLTDAELAGLNVGHLIIGDAASGTGDISVQSWNLSGKSYDIELFGRDIDINGMTMGAGDITIIAGNDVGVSGAIGNNGTGGDLYIDVGNDFANTAGASAITMGPGGRSLIYIDSLSNISRGGMTTGNLFGRDYAGNAPSTIGTSFGSRFVFDETPTITVTANDVTLPAYNGGYNSFTYGVTGLATSDTAGSALSGTPSYSKTQLTPTTYRITPGSGTLTSTLGYLISFQNGLLTMPVDTGIAPTPTPPPAMPVVTLPPSVEHQIQTPQILFNQGIIPSYEQGQASVYRKEGTYRVTTPETDSFTRMIEGGYLQIEQDLIDYYDLYSYNALYIANGQ